jgi:polysaccharide export outer membrane protein
VECVNKANRRAACTPRNNEVNQKTIILALSTKPKAKRKTLQYTISRLSSLTSLLVKHVAKTRLKNLTITLVVALTVSSCIPNKKVIYMQDEANQVPLEQIIEYDYPEYRLQKGDILDVQVKSADPKLAEALMGAQTANMMQGMQLVQTGSDIFYLTGYTVNENGDLELPVIGMVNVEGKTLAETKPAIADSIAKKAGIIDPYVTVKLGGIRFTAFGEFNRPGRFGILQNDVTIFEAIANAGDLTVLADRQHALLIRQYPDGQKIHEIDLTDRSLITSEFYHIQPNDQLYLPPLKAREWGTGITGFQTFTAVVGTVTSILLIWNLVAN